MGLRRGVADGVDDGAQRGVEDEGVSQVIVHGLCFCPAPWLLVQLQETTPLSWMVFASKAACLLPLPLPFSAVRFRTKFLAANADFFACAAALPARLLT